MTSVALGSKINDSYFSETFVHVDFQLKKLSKHVGNLKKLIPNELRFRSLADAYQGVKISIRMLKSTNLITKKDLKTANFWISITKALVQADHMRYGSKELEPFKTGLLYLVKALENVEEPDKFDELLDEIPD